MGIQSSIADLANLKRLAEAVNQTYADLCEHGGDQLAEAWNSAELAYDDAANPQVVLGLLAEVETLRKDAERYRWLRVRLIGVLKDWDDSGKGVLGLSFKIPGEGWRGCDESIDVAMAEAGN